MAMTLRLDDDEQAVLRAMAEREGLSQHEVARRAILERAERIGHRDDVHDAGTRAVTRYSALLERLSQ
ncbi:MAG: ribbon-helix-helix protein, CopG family [Pseudorhodobacter sp.]|nr:ribbon-helix-helix protein, CopG family [Frankiaceae bacterium]